MAALGIFYIRIVVADLARAKQFYGHTLGWSLGTDEPGVAGFSFGAGYLVVSEGVVRASDGGFEVAVRVDDIEAQHERLVSAGASPTPIESRPWGERNFTVHDPDGYLWVFGQVAG